MTIDPRLIERRKTVAEDNAKRNLSRLLKFLVAGVMVGALVWLLFSPWLSVRRVETEGVATSSAQAILAERGVVAGSPMFQVSSRATEEALLEDPWIADADVDKDWPDLVSVVVTEREPLAWTWTESGWTRRAVDGVALPSASEPDDEMARVEMADLADVAAATAPDMVGALEFIETLPAELRTGTMVTTIEGELWASVSGFQVRLGRAVEMREKALSLTALLAEPIPDGSVLTLIAPTNPSVLAPGADQERAGTAAETDTGSDPDEEGSGDGP